MKLYNVISILNNEYGSKASVPYNKNNLQLIKLLYNEGYITSYIIFYNKMKIDIEFSFYEGNRVYNGIKLFYKMYDYYNININQLKKLNKKRKKIILSTTYGLLLINKAIKYGIGGKVLGELK